MQKANVLICDDNETVHKSLAIYLEEEGINAISAFNGEEALKLFRISKVDLVVLDVMLPDMSGMDICRDIRRISNVPIIMLSAKSEEIDRIIGLELGADDYVTKPFSPREMSIRIRNLLKRMHSISDVQKYSFEELEAYPESMEIFVNREKIPFTPKETKIVIYLVCNANKVLSREQILNAVWGYDYCEDTRVVDTLIKRIRQKLPSENVHFNIHAIYGVGYKLEGFK